VDGVFNAIQVQGDLIGQMVFYGRGAGAKPTASGLMGDILDVAQAVRYGEKRRVAAVQGNGKRVAPIEELRTRYYFRILAKDRPGVLAQISQVFGKWEFSIASVIQKETDEVAQTAELVILTHTSTEASVRRAVEEMRGLPVVEDIGSLIRVEV
jgi:homoserine dehydrogenase